MSRGCVLFGVLCLVCGVWCVMFFPLRMAFGAWRVVCGFSYVVLGALCVVYDA